MLNLEDCYKYQSDIKRVTKANSFIASGRVIYIVKKSAEGKSLKIYVAYDRETKIQLLAHWNKDKLIRYIQGKDLSMLGGNVQMSLF